MPQILRYNNSLWNFDEKPNTTAVNPYQTKILKKQLAAFDNFIPTKDFDYDRLNEEKEDFM